jgi:hypothetical protein
MSELLIFIEENRRSKSSVHKTMNPTKKKIALYFNKAYIFVYQYIISIREKFYAIYVMPN